MSNTGALNCSDDRYSNKRSRHDGVDEFGRKKSLAYFRKEEIGKSVHKYVDNCLHDCLDRVKSTSDLKDLSRAAQQTNIISSFCIRDHLSNESAEEKFDLIHKNLDTTHISRKPSDSSFTPANLDRGGPLANITSLPSQTIHTVPDEFEKELSTVYFPECPRIINNVDLSELVSRLNREWAEISCRSHSEDPTSLYRAIFSLSNDSTSLITRAIQEDEILKTQLKTRRGNDLITLPSFWEVYQTNPALRKDIIMSDNANDAKWRYQKRYGYKLATTFMPCYAKSLFEYFQAKRVLDPCAG
jgi:hypothetical protein